MSQQPTQSTALSSTKPQLPSSLSQAYHALLIRYWHEGESGQWRFLVQDVRTGEQYAFAELDLLLAFLSQQVDARN